MKKGIALLFAAAMILLPLIGMQQAAASQALPQATTGNAGGPIVASLSGRTIVANGTTQGYVLNVTGGPVGQGNYSYTAFVYAKNTTGLSVTPTTGTDAQGVFYLNLTAGVQPEIVTLTINITAGAGSQQVYSVKSFLVNVVRPVTVTVPVTNEGPSGVQNANVSLYVDGSYVQSRNVTLSAGQTTNVTFTWLAYHYPAGSNIATVSINASGHVLFSNGETQTSFTIYIPGGTTTAIDNYLVVGCIVAGIVLFMIYFRKPKPRF